jgi:hypothetical protein
MDSTFGVLDAFAFVVFAVLIAVAVIAIVSFGAIAGPARAEMGTSAGFSSQRRQLDRPGNRGLAVATGFDLGLHDSFQVGRFENGER